MVISVESSRLMTIAEARRLKIDRTIDSCFCGLIFLGEGSSFRSCKS